MHTKIAIVATIAALSLATAAFAGEGNGNPFPYRAPGVTLPLGAAEDTVAVAPFSEATLPTVGAEGTVQTANSLPVGAMDGTPAVRQANATNQWFAQQAAHRFAALQAHRPNG